MPWGLGQGLAFRELGRRGTYSPSDGSRSVSNVFRDGRWPPNHLAHYTSLGGSLIVDM